MFYGATGIASPVAGRLTDRIGARRAVALDQALIAVALLVGAAFPVYPVLLAGAVVAGSGYALTNTATQPGRVRRRACARARGWRSRWAAPRA